MSIMTYKKQLSIDLLHAKERLNLAIEWENHVRQLYEYARSEVKMARINVDYIIKEISEKDVT